VLPLDDPRWSQLTHAYGKASDIPAKLRQLGADPPNADRVWPELDFWSSLCHQGSIYEATFAAIPYVVASARALDPVRRIDLLQFVGYSVASAALPRAAVAPADLLPAYQAAVRESVDLLADTLRHRYDENTTWNLFGALAAVQGHVGLSHVLFNLGCSIERPGCGEFIEPMESNLNTAYVLRRAEHGGDDI
jgi:hypothetical protein